MPLISPIHWFEVPFVDGLIRGDFTGVVPETVASECRGIRTVTEVYRKVFDEGWYQGEVSYDPSIGYIPRYIRLISTNSDGSASIKEAFIQDARPCKEGGFVPTEWCETSFRLEGFEKTYPNYSHDTQIRPQGDISIGHFTVNRLVDQIGPVALQADATTRGISAAWRSVMTSRFRGPITLRVIKEVLGNAPVTPAFLPANIDMAEQGEYVQQPGRSNYWIAALIAMAVGLALGFLALRKRARFLAIFLALAVAPCTEGCQRATEGPPLLSLAFEDPLIVYEPAESALNVGLRITNPGPQSVRIFGIDGGCSCRKLDRSRLPLTLGGGNSVVVRMTIENRHHYEPMHINFQFATGLGSLGASAVLHAMPRHHINPESMTILALEEDKEDAVEFVHRRIIRASGGHDSVGLQVSSDFILTKVGSHGGRVTHAPDLRYEDTRYLLTLKNKSIGTFKDTLVLTGHNGKQILEVPITWRRYAFLTVVPDRVILGPRPVRMFLRCPDETVEFTKVLSSPKGVTAVVRSEREVSARLVDGAPDIIDGVIEIGTTAKAGHPLKVPVVRYALAPNAQSRGG